MIRLGSASVESTKVLIAIFLIRDTVHRIINISRRNRNIDFNYLVVIHNVCINA